jgi:hypothetical protein
MKKSPTKLKLPGKFDPQMRWLLGYLIAARLESGRQPLRGGGCLAQESLSHE